MKPIIFSLAFLFATSLYGFKEAALEINRTATDTQIEAVKKQVYERYGFKVDVTVIARNSKGEITNLEFVRYAKDGSRGGGCSSDNFGLLIITPDGCKIADLGHEKRLRSM